MKFRIVFWDVLSCKIIVDRRVRGACCLHHQGDDSSLMIKAARTSETSVDYYFTRQYIPEDNSERQKTQLVPKRSVNGTLQAPKQVLNYHPKGRRQPG
jgi:hypothetical protein